MNNLVPLAYLGPQGSLCLCWITRYPLLTLDHQVPNAYHAPLDTHLHNLGWYVSLTYLWPWNIFKTSIFGSKSNQGIAEGQSTRSPRTPRRMTMQRAVLYLLVYIYIYTHKSLMNFIALRGFIWFRQPQSLVLTFQL